MATARDCEGNIISPLGKFKHLPIVSTSSSTPSITGTKSVMSTPVPVTIMSHFPRVTTLYFPSSPIVPSITLTEDKPVVSSLDLKVVFPVKSEALVRRSQPSQMDMAYSPGGATGPCIPAKVLEYIDNTLTNEREDIKQALISFNFVMKELCNKFGDSSSDISANHDHEPIICLECSGFAANKVIKPEKFVDQQNNVFTSPSPLANNWIDLLLQLRRDNGQQLKELQAAVREKDKKLISQVQHIKKLKTRISSLVHEDNMDHLSRQQSMTSYSSSDCASVSSQFSDNSSYKESSCVSSSELLQSVPGHKQFPPAVSHRRIHSKSVSSQSSPVSSRNQPMSVLSHREAADNVENRRRQDQTDFISRIGHKVDTLAVHYSPGKYDSIIGTNHTSTKVHDDPDNLVDPVPRELFAIWFCQGDLTEEEEEKFNKFMEAENRPPVIHSPSFAKPRVNWMKVNKWQLRNLPEPELFPVHSVPQDPDYYGTAYVKEYVERHGGLFGCMGVPKGCGCIRCNPPWGRCSGLRTNHGIIGMPTEPVHGYVWSGSDGWVLYAGGSYG